jgi:hypothetical protein
MRVKLLIKSVEVINPQITRDGVDSEGGRGGGRGLRFG